MEGEVGRGEEEREEREKTPVAKLNCGSWRKSGERKEWNGLRVTGSQRAPITT